MRSLLVAGIARLLHLLPSPLRAGYLYETYGHGALDCQDAATGPTNACQWGLRGG